MTHQPPLCPLIAADIVILGNHGEDVVLLIERKNEPHGWALPGGFVDCGESCEDAAVRELKEETTLEAVSDLELIGVYSEPKRDPRMHVVSTAYYCESAVGIPEAKDDATNIGFFPVINLPELAFPDHYDMIIKALRMKGGV